MNQWWSLDNSRHLEEYKGLVIAILLIKIILKLTRVAFPDRGM